MHEGLQHTVLEDSAAAAAFDYDLFPKLADLLPHSAGWVTHVQQQHLHTNESQRIASSICSSLTRWQNTYCAQRLPERNDDISRQRDKQNLNKPQMAFGSVRIHQLRFNAGTNGSIMS